VFEEEEHQEHDTNINTKLNSVSSFSHVLILTISPSFDSLVSFDFANLDLQFFLSLM